MPSRRAGEKAFGRGDTQQVEEGVRIAYANPLRGVGDVTSMAVISFFGYFMIAARSFAGAGLQ